MSYCMMIVDDERSIREGLSVACDWEKIGIGQILLAADGSEALKLLEDHHVDIVISDIVMPEIDGLELCGILSRKYPNLMLFLLTGFGEFEYAQKAIRYGVRDYILKPSDEHVLSDVIQKAVEELDDRKNSHQRLIDLEREVGSSLPQEKRQALHDYITDALQDWNSPKELPAQMPDYKGNNPVVLRILDYIEQHISDEKLSLNSIASEHLFMNGDYVGKIFKKEMGQKFSTYLLMRRMQLAAKYLRESPYARIYEIADRVGFGSNSSYFSAVFKKVTGKSPSEYP